VKNDEIKYTINSPHATFTGREWDAKDAILKTHIYKNNVLQNYKVEYKKSIKTLKGYKPKIIASLYEGKALNIINGYHTFKLLASQGLNTDKIRASLYNKVIVPLFSISLLVILFFKLPFHARMVNMGSVIALSLGVTFMIWGVLFGLNQMGVNGVIAPELSAILPICLLFGYALIIYFTDERTIS
jgi:lipopolysaccharide export system permease protein